jgi:hypothetical protein
MQEKPCNSPSSAEEGAPTEAEIASMFTEARALDSFFSGCARRPVGIDTSARRTTASEPCASVK